jgi:Ca2+-binding EF-hand superfamily protein
MILSTYFRSEVIEKWNKCFNSLDTDGTGQIKITKVIEMMKESNVNPKRISDLGKIYKNNLDATISYSDFLTKVINVRREISEEDVQKAFDQLDVDKSGKIEEGDLTSLLQRRGHEHIKAQTLMHEIDGKNILMANNESEASDNFTEQIIDRNEIGFGTFKDYIFGDMDDVSEYSDYTNGSSFVYSSKVKFSGNVPGSLKGSMASNYGSIMINIDERECEEAKAE